MKIVKLVIVAVALAAIGGFALGFVAGVYKYGPVGEVERGVYGKVINGLPKRAVVFM